MLQKSLIYQMPVHTISEIIEDLQQGKMIILLDDENRENEGDLVMAANQVTAQHINFMVHHACGLICLPITPEHAQQLDLKPMVTHNTNPLGTHFTLSVDAAQGITTGISAADRAHTIRVVAHPKATPDQLVTPGHIFPIIAKPNGVLERAGHTEASCDLMRLANLGKAAVIVEILNADGTMARKPDLEIFAKLHQLKITTIEQLIEYRLRIDEATAMGH